jgi:hypothetical protein
MFNAKQKKALAIAGVSVQRISRAEKALMPKPKKLRQWEILRIEELRASDGVAIVTRKRIWSKQGWDQKKNEGHKHLKAYKFKPKAKAATPPPSAA